MHMSRRLSSVVAKTSLRKLTLLPAAVDYLQPFNYKWGLVNHASTHTGILAILALAGLVWQPQLVQTHCSKQVSLSSDSYNLPTSSVTFPELWKKVI